MPLSDFILPQGVRVDQRVAEPVPEPEGKTPELQAVSGEFVLFTQAIFYLWLPRIDPIMDLVPRRPEIELFRFQADRPYFDIEQYRTLETKRVEQWKKWNHSIIAVAREHWPLIRAHMEASILTDKHIPFGGIQTIETTVPDNGVLQKSVSLPAECRQPAYVFGVETEQNHTVVEVGQPWEPTKIRFARKQA